MKLITLLRIDRAGQAEADSVYKQLLDGTESFCHQELVALQRAGR